MPCRTAASLLILGFILFLSACAQTDVITDAASPNDALNEYYHASDAETLANAISNLAESDYSAAEVAQWLRAGIQYPDDATTGWSTYEFVGPDGRSRPFHVYVPTDYDSTQAYPVLFDLHGAVSTLPQPVEYLVERRRLWEQEAEAYGWILVVPQGDRYATWFSVNGHANLLGELDDVKRHYNVDENKVFVSGFSDGGSGAYWMAFHDPTPWAGLISFHGHPAIGGYGPYQTYPRNLLNRPIRATSGETDALYPPADVGPYVDLFEQLGVEIEWVIYPGGHEAGFLTTEAEFTVAFISQTSRNPFSPEVVWETSDPDAGRCDWVRIDEIADVDVNAEFRDINLAEIPEQIVFGAALAYQGGSLFTVAGLEVGSAAHLMGIKNGDQILRIDGVDVLTQTDIGATMVGKAPGDPVEVEIVRDGEPLVLMGRIPDPDLVYSRNAMTGSIHVTATGNQIDVLVRNVGRYTLFISSEQFDLSQPIEVITNGETSYSGTVAPDMRFMLEQAAADFDRRAVYEARIEVVVGGGKN